MRIWYGKINERTKSEHCVWKLVYFALDIEKDKKKIRSMRNKLNHKRVAPSSTYAAQRWIILFHVRTKWQYEHQRFVCVGVHTHQDHTIFSFRKKIYFTHI